jgi:hypothetical protein
MPFQAVNLREKYDHARRHFDHQLAAMLTARTDLSHAQIGQRFGVGDKVIRRVVKQFDIAARKRGPKSVAIGGMTSVTHDSVSYRSVS